MTYNTKYKSPYQIDIDLTQNPNQFETFIDNNDTPACLFYKLNSTTIKNLVLNDCSGERFYNIFNNVSFNILESLEVNLVGNVEALTTYMQNLKKLTIIAHNTNNLLFITNTNFPSLEYLKIRGTSPTISISTLKELDTDYENTGIGCDNIEKVYNTFGECKTVNGVYKNLSLPVADCYDLSNHNASKYYLNDTLLNLEVPIFTNCPNLKLVSLISKETKTTSSQIFENCANVEEVIISDTIEINTIQNLNTVAPNARIIYLGNNIEGIRQKFPGLFVSNNIQDSLYINQQIYNIAQQSEFTIEFSEINSVDSEHNTIYLNDLDILKIIKPASGSICHIKNFVDIPSYTFLNFWNIAIIILHGHIDNIEHTNFGLVNSDLSECCINNYNDSLIVDNITSMKVSSCEILNGKMFLKDMKKFKTIIKHDDELENVILNDECVEVGEVYNEDMENVYVFNEVDTGNSKLLSYNLGLATNLICRCENCVDFVNSVPNNFTATVYNNYYNYLRLKSLGLSAVYIGTIPERINTKYFNNSIINHITNLTDLSTINALDDSQGKLHLKLNSLNNLYELSEFITEKGSSNTFLEAGVTTLSGITNTTYNNRFSNLTKLSNLTTGGIEIGFNKNLQPYDARNLKELTITGQELDCLNRSNIGNNETVPSTKLTRLKFSDTKKLRGRISIAECCSNLQELDLTGCENMDNVMSFLSECSHVSDVWYNNINPVIVGSNPSWKVNSSVKIHCSDFYLRHELFTNGKIWGGDSQTALLPLTSYIYDILNTNKLKEQANELILTQEFLAVYDPKGYINWDKIPYSSKKSIKRLYTGARKLDLYCFEALEYLESKTLEEIVITNNNLREIDLHGDVCLKKLSIHTNKQFYINLDGCVNLKEFNLNVGSVNNFDIKSDYLTDFGLLVSSCPNYGNITNIYLTSNRFGREETDEICINSNVKMHYSGPQKNFENLKYKLDLNLDFANNILPDVLTNIDNFTKTFYQRISTTQEDKQMLRTIIFKDIMTIDESAFKDFSNLINIEFNDVQYIKHNAFENCTSLKNITLNKVKVIGTDAFKGCMLENVVIGSCCELIKPYAFEQVNNLTINSGEITPESLGLVNHLNLQYYVPYEVLKHLKLYVNDLRTISEYKRYEGFLMLFNNYFEDFVDSTNRFIPDKSDLFWYFNRFTNTEDDAIPEVNLVRTNDYIDEFGMAFTNINVSKTIECLYPMNNLIWRNCFKYNGNYIRNTQIRKITFSKPIRRLIIYVEGSGDEFVLHSNQSKFLSVDYVYDQYRASHFSSVNANFPLNKIISNKDIGDINVYVYQNSVEYLTTTLGKDYLLVSQNVPSYQVKCSVWWFVPATKPKQLICIASAHNTTNYDHTIASDFYIYKRHSATENAFVSGLYFNKRLKKFISDGYDDSVINLKTVLTIGYEWEHVENLTTLIINDGPLIFNRMNNLINNLFKDSRFINLIDFTDFDNGLPGSTFEYAYLKGKTLKLKQISPGNGGYQCSRTKNGKIICSKATSLSNNFANISNNLSIRCQTIGSIGTECFAENDNSKIILPDVIIDNTNSNFWHTINTIIKGLRVYTISGKWTFNDFNNCILQDIEEVNITNTGNAEIFIAEGARQMYGPIFCPNIKRININSNQGFGNEAGYGVNYLLCPNIELIESSKQRIFKYCEHVYLPNIALLKSSIDEPKTFCDTKFSYIKINNIATTHATPHHLFMATTDSYLEILNCVIENGKKVLKNFSGGCASVKNSIIHLEEFDVIEGDYIFETMDVSTVYLKSSVSFPGSYVWGNSSTSIKGHIQIIYVDTNTTETKTIYGYPS